MKTKLKYEGHIHGEAVYSHSAVSRKPHLIYQSLCCFFSILWRETGREGGRVYRLSALSSFSITRTIYGDEIKAANWIS